MKNEAPKMSLTNVTATFGSSLEGYISASTNSFFIFSPFISNNTLIRLLGNKQNVTIVTSWKEEHLLRGVSSLDLYPLCKKKNWKLYINSRLHAKIYSEGLTSGYIGSANCTNHALYDPKGNIECMIFVKSFSFETKIELNEVIHRSYLVNEDIFSIYLDWYSKQKLPTIEYGELQIDSPKAISYSIYELPSLYEPQIMRDYLKNPEKYSRYSSYAEHDVAIYGSLNLTGSEGEYLNRVADQFFEHPFIKEIDKHITNEGIYFGEFKELIQKICTDVPVPYRYELTELVQNLMRWFTVLAPYDYGLRREHISQCLYRIN